MRNAILLMAFLLCMGCSSDEIRAPSNTTGSNQSSGKTDNAVEGDAGLYDDAYVFDTAGDGGTFESDGDLIPTPDAEPEPVVDPFEQAWDVTIHRVEFPEGTGAPDYRRAAGVSRFSLGGTEFWQKWPTGHNPTYSYSEGTELGRRCMFASARRFEAIMTDPPQAIIDLVENSDWRGSFFNWNDDFSESEWGDGRSARLWAWRTTLVKWISQTNVDGSCYLPTYEMVEELAESCAIQAARREGEIQGCRAP
ncbi:MAG: hypothetical protein VYA30_16665 [Myxococcota bacterium]|nr:hypothetical protein [Myxococcota bacterium]